MNINPTMWKTKALFKETKCFVNEEKQLTT